MWTDLGFVTGSGTTSQARYYSFDDASPQLPAPIEYRIRQIDYDGSTTYSNVLRIESEDLPSEILLEANYPNPFTEKTTIAFTLETSRDATLIITDITGREIRRIGNVSNGRAGRHEVSIVAGDLPAGLYVYRLESGLLIHRCNSTIEMSGYMHSRNVRAIYQTDSFTEKGSHRAGSIAHEQKGTRAYRDHA
jgi:hypothetical protein